MNLNWERVLLVSFFGNFIINSVVTALVSLLPASQGGGMFTPQYITYVILSAIVVFLLAWWYFAPIKRTASVLCGTAFGVVGFVIAILTVLISSSSSVLQQTGSFSQLVSVLPNFGPYLMTWTTLVVFGYWVIPALLAGWVLGRQYKRAMPAAAPQMQHVQG